MLRCICHARNANTICGQVASKVRAGAFGIIRRMAKINAEVTPASTGRVFRYDLLNVDDYAEFVPEEPNPGEDPDKELFDLRFGLSYLLMPAAGGGIQCEGHMGDRENGSVHGALSADGWFNLNIGEDGLVDEETGGAAVAPVDRLKFTAKTAAPAVVIIRTGRSPIGLPLGA